MRRGKWTKIGRDLREALATYATAYEALAPEGSIAALIDEAVVTVRRIATDLRPGVLDDLNAGAANRTLGPTWHQGRPALALWAPTARSVSVTS